MNVGIRWMVRRDMPEVLPIDAADGDPWGEGRILKALRQRNRIGMVAEHGDRVVGFMLFELGERIDLLRLAVAADCRRRGVGRQLVGKVVGKLSPERRPRLDCDVRESNLPGLLFLKECGFWATKLLMEWYDDTGEDGIQMSFKVAVPAWATAGSAE